MVSFRHYQHSDKEQVLEIFRSNVPKFFAAREKTDFVKFLENSKHYFVLDQDNQLLGCGGYGISHGQGYLAWGMVHRLQHSTGLGKRLLLERLHLIAQNEGVTSIVLDTSQHTFGFFEKLGFATQKITLDSYAAGLHRYDMKLELNEGSSKLIEEKLKLLLGAKGFANSVVNNQKENH